jgi:hypothetical protein
VPGGDERLRAAAAGVVTSSGVSRRPSDERLRESAYEAALAIAHAVDIPDPGQRAADLKGAVALLDQLKKDVRHSYKWAQRRAVTS